MTILTPWPEHQNPSPQQSASAPYNFVPLPEKIIRAVHDADELPDHDKYYHDRLSGYFDVTLTTRSPLYIRGPVSAKDFPHQEEKDSSVKNKPEFFHNGDESTPVIPGSSLRGMLRALLEIVSYGKMQWVSEKQLFFRTVDDSAVGTYYNHRMVEELGIVHSTGHPPAPGYHARVEGGFFRVRKDGTYFIEECTIARVDTPDLLRLFGLKDSRDLYELDGKDLYERTARNPNQTPKWLYQHREIWADIEETENDYFFPQQFTIDRNNRRRMRHPDLYLRFRRARNLAVARIQGRSSGKVVLTGHMNYKHLAFLFVPLEPTIPLEVPNDPREQDPNKRLVDRFHDDDQLTPWQKKAFPAGKPPNGQQRQRDGHLRDGDPVFFLRDENQKLVFFGRTQMFRLPYTRSPFDLVDPSLRSARHIDYADALFGFVRTSRQLEELGTVMPKQGDKQRAYASRVIVTDAVLRSDPANIWLAGNFDKEIVPRILATPKPTAFQHYLTQQHPNVKRELDHYDNTLPDNNKPTIRGHKLYWHQGLGTDQDLTLEHMQDAIKGPDQLIPGDTQHTRFKPLRPEVQFSFRVYFENLSDCELGALCWTLHPHGETGRRYCHHLGMGKPLGMGAVELHACLHIIDRPLRYRKLFNDNGDSWQLGESTENENLSNSTHSTSEVSEASTGEDLSVAEVLDRLTRPFEEHLLLELNPSPPCTRLADMLRIAMLLKLLEWPGYRAEEGGTAYLANQQPPRPNTRYMQIQPNEYRDRLVLPDPMQFDDPYFKGKSRPQGTQASTLRQALVEKNIQQPAQSPELAEFFPVGRELSNMVDYTQSEQGVEVRFWNLDPTQIIGFIPGELIKRQLGPKISVVVTGLRQEVNGRLVVELKLRPKR